MNLEGMTYQEKTAALKRHRSNLKALLAEKLLARKINKLRQEVAALESVLRHEFGTTIEPVMDYSQLRELQNYMKLLRSTLRTKKQERKLAALQNEINQLEVLVGKEPTKVPIRSEAKI